MGGSTQVIPTTNNTQQKVEIPQYLQDAGQTAVAKATDYSNTPFQPFSGQTVAPLTANQKTAGSIAANSTNAGMSFLDSARQAMAGGSTALGQAGQIANDNATTGMDSGNTGAALARLAGVSANDNQGAGTGDLNGAERQVGLANNEVGQADRYNSMSAGPVTADQISSYFNPYIQTALDPTIGNLTRSSGATDAALRSKAGMEGAFGGSRATLQQTQNNADLLRQIATTSGDAYSTGYDKALAAAQADKTRQGAAAGTSINAAGTLLSGANTLNTTGMGRNTIANDTVSRLTSSAGANTAAGLGQSSLGAYAQQRFLSLINPSLAVSGENRALGSTESALSNDAINRLETTGQVEQTANQNQNNADYQQYLNEQNYRLQQINALIAAAGGTPYGTSTDVKNQGTQVVQSPSMLGQLAGAAAGLGGAAIMASDRDAKEDFGTVDDEDVLARFRGLTVETYRYKPEVRDVVGDDGRERIGPMAQDWAKHFGGDGKVIPMPEIIGGLVSAVRALDRRTTRQDSSDHGAALRRLAA